MQRRFGAAVVIGLAMVGVLVAMACGLSVSGETASAVDATPEGGGFTGDATQGDAPSNGDAADGAFDATIFPGDHVVFVTTNQPTGAMGGLAGADGICQTEAVTSKHPALGGRAFQAWLSDATTGAAKRYDKPAGRYVLPSGIVVANDFAQLTSGTLAHPIDENAKGEIAPNTRVWTGTLPDGAPSGSNCGGWTINLANLVGTTGRIDAGNSDWTFLYNEVCNDDWPLYCISQ